MDAELFTRLEARIEQLLEKYHSLEEENRLLSQRLDCLQRERMEATAIVDSVLQRLDRIGLP